MKFLKCYGMVFDLILFYLVDRGRNDNVENDVKVEISMFIIV